MIPAWHPEGFTHNPAQMVDRALLWGIEALELGAVGSPGERVPYVNERPLRRRLADAELGVTSVTPGLFHGRSADRAAWLNELTMLGEIVEFCSRFGCSAIIASTFDATSGADAVSEAIRMASDRIRSAGMRLVLEAAEQDTCKTACDLAGLLDSVGHDSLLAAWDPVVAQANGEDPATGWKDLAGRVGLIRFRPDSGLDWAGLLERAAADGFEGPVSLVLSAGSTGREGLVAATDMIQMMRASGSRLADATG